MTTRAKSVNFQMSRYWCASKAEQRAEGRIKIIILLWANNSQTVSIESHWELNSALVFRGKRRPGGHMEISQILQTSIYILKYGKEWKTEERRGCVCRHSSSVIIPLNTLATTPLQQLQLSPTQYVQKSKGSAKKLKKKNTHLKIEIQFLWKPHSSN